MAGSAKPEPQAASKALTWLVSQDCCVALGALGSSKVNPATVAAQHGRDGGVDGRGGEDHVARIGFVALEDVAPVDQGGIRHQFVELLD